MIYQIVENGSTSPQPVSKFSSLNMGFNTFNPPQSRFVLENLHSKNVNILACWLTSTGKTVIAELITEQTLNQNLKTIYACPLKALAEEKITRFKKLFPDAHIEIFTGDYLEIEKRQEKIQKANIIIATTELIDSISRNKKLSELLFKNTGAIIIDEAHILGTERGPTVEAALIRITTLNPDIRLILLSATLSNAQEIAEWITQLNNKPTYILESSWRPVKIDWHTIPVNIENALSYPEKVKILIQSAVSLVHTLLKEEPDTSILFFVWTKTEGYMVKEELEIDRIPCEFHNASLELKQRLFLEEAFNNNKIKVLISTTTLAWGRNTCARHVIILGTRRGLQFVQSWDVIQAGGRAGRTGLAPKGDVWWLYPFTPQDEEFVQQTLSQVPPVISFLIKPEHLAFHLLGEFRYKKETTGPQIVKWFSKTLASKQLNSKTKSIDILASAIDYLIEHSCLKFLPEKNAFTLTLLGNVARTFYFSPAEIKAFYNALFRLLKLTSEISIPDNNCTHFFSSLDKEKLGIGAVLFLSHLSAKNDNYLSSSEKKELSLLEFSSITEKFFSSSVSSSFLFSFPKEIRYLVYKWLFWYEKHCEALVLKEKRPPVYWRLKDILVDLDRITAALINIAEHILKAPFLKEFIRQTAILLKTGALIETIHLLEIPGIGPVKATQLLQLGITTPEQLIEALKTDKKTLIEKILPRKIIMNYLASKDKKLLSSNSLPS